MNLLDLKSKNVFYEKIDGKECNTAKGVSIATEFNKFKDVLFNKKNDKRYDKRYVLDDEIHT